MNTNDEVVLDESEHLLEHESIKGEVHAEVRGDGFMQISGSGFFNLLAHIRPTGK